MACSLTAASVPAVGKRRGDEGIDAGVVALRLLGKTRPDRQAEIRSWAEFDIGVRAVAGRFGELKEAGRYSSKKGLRLNG